LQQTDFACAPAATTTRLTLREPDNSLQAEELALEDKPQIFTSATRNVRSTERAMNRKSLVDGRW
jgi:hypothetical protein